MKSSFLILILLCLSISINATPYQKHSSSELKKIFNLNKQGGKYYASPNLEALLTVIESLEIHAIGYPVFFDQDSEKLRAQKETLFLSNMLDLFFPKMKENRTFLNMALRINNIAYNLDVQPIESMSRVKKAAKSLFLLDPNDSESHFRFGAFLASANNVDEGIAHLELAVAQDYYPAYFMLSIAYIMNNENKKAIDMLEMYKARVPNDGNIDKMIEAIRHGNIKVH